MYTLNNTTLDALKITSGTLTLNNQNADVLSLRVGVDPGVALSTEFTEGGTLTLRQNSTIIFVGEVQPKTRTDQGEKKSHSITAKGGFQLLADTPFVVDGLATATIPQGTPSAQLTWLWTNSDIAPGLTLSHALPTHTNPEAQYSNTTLASIVQSILATCETAAARIDYSTTPPTLQINHIDPADAYDDRPQIDLATDTSSTWTKATKACPSVHLNYVRDTQVTTEWTDRFGVLHSSSANRQDLVSADIHPTAASPEKFSVVTDLTLGGTKNIRDVSSVYKFTNGGTSGYQTLGHLKDKYYFGSYYAHVGILKAVKAMNFESKTGLELEEFGVIDNDYKGYGIAEGNYWYPIISSINVEELYNPSGITYAEDDLFWLREVPVVGSYYASSQVNLITEELKDVAGVVFCRADITVKWWTGVPTISPNTNKSTTWSVDCIYKAAWNGSAWVADWTAGDFETLTRQIIEEVDYETPPTGLAQSLHTVYNLDRYKATHTAYAAPPPAAPVCSLMNNTTHIGPALLQSVALDLTTHKQTLTLGPPVQLNADDLFQRQRALKT